MTTTTIAGALALCLTVDSAQALPANGEVRGGQARITTRAGRTTVNQTSERGIIDWSTFNVAAGETVQFIQPNASAITLNRVSDVSPSVIDGTITATGQVWLVNPQGVMFGKNASVNVGGLLATSSDISNSNFMAGNYRFTKPGSATATISNAGTLTAASGGVITLAGPNVSNSGIITASLGKVQLASGDAFTLDLYGDGLINLQASPAITQQLVSNSGTINAQGGQVLLTAAAAENLVNSLVNMSGVIDADTAGGQQGQVNITALGSNAVANNVAANKGQLQGDSEVLVSGSISASGKGTGQTGGAITVTGDNVGILSGSVIDASGDAGGGVIQIGGDFHGLGSTPTALHTIVQSGATIDASAVNTGNGGDVTVWADQWTTFAGSILAHGGVFSGNGGYVETSGKVNLSMNGSVDASAPHGNAGTWLMDPADVTISSSDGNITGNSTSPNFTPTGAGEATINVTDITTALNNGSNVTITTGGDSYAGTNNGQITVATPITLSTASNNNATLTLSAYSNILVNANITAPTTGTGKLNVILDSDNASAAGGGYIIISGNISTNGGDLTMGGGSLSGGFPTSAAVGNSGTVTGSGIILSGTTLNAAGGNIVMNGTAGAGTSYSWSVYLVNTTTVETSGTGNISITGNAPGGGYSSEYGIDVHTGTNTIKNTGTGSITLTGTGGPGSGPYNIGIFIEGGTNTILSTGGGSIVLNGIGGGGSSAGFGTGNGGTTTIGGASENGNITLTQNSLSFGIFGGNTTIQTTGNVLIEPYSANTTVTVAGNSTGLGLTSTYLGYITAGSISIGNIADTGNMSVGAYSWNAPLSLISGNGTISITGNQTMGANNFTLQSDATPSFSANVTTTGTVTLLPASHGTTIGVAGGAGNLAIGTGILGDITAGNIVIGSGNDTGLMTVAANTWNSNLTLLGGTGNITTTGNQAMGGNNLTITADNLSLGGALSGNGTLTLQPYTTSLSEAIGSGASGSWTLGNATIAEIGTGWATVNIGNANLTGAAQLGNITFPTLTTSNATYNIYGGNMTFVGNSVNYNNVNYYAESGDLNISSAQSWNTSSGTHTTTAYSSAGNITINAAVTATYSAGVANLVFDDNLGSTGNISVNANITSVGSVTLQAMNNITVNTGYTLTAGGSGGITLNAANGNTSNTGVLTDNGVLVLNYGSLTLSSGLSGGGIRSNITLNSANFMPATGGGGSYQNIDALYISGFNNVTLGEVIKANIVGVSANGNLTINNSLQNSSSYSGNVSATSGIYLNADLTSFNSGGTNGFWNITGPVIISGSRTISTGGGAITITGTVDATTSGVDSLTLNSGVGKTKITGAVGNTTPLGNLSITADSLSLGGNVYGTGTLTLAPYTAGTVMHLNDGTSTGWYLNSTEVGYIQPDWGSVVIGSTAGTGNMTVGATTWGNALTLETGSGTVSITGNQTMGANTFTLETNATPSLSGNVTTSGIITVETSGNTTLGVGTNATGTVNISNATLADLTGGSYVFGSTTTGNVDINTSQTNITVGNLTFISGGTIYLDESGDTSPQALTKSSGGASTLTFQAGTDIVTAGAITASGTGNSENVILDSAWVASGAGTSGAIVVGGNITSNGGNITLGGGSAPGTYAAMGDVSHTAGISIASSTLNAGTGNVLLTGAGYNGNDYSTDAGVDLASSNVQASATGSISIYGTTTGNYSDANHSAIHLNGGNISTADGNIVVSGNNTASGSSSTDRGIYDSSATIQSTGNGTITLTGSAGSGTGGSNFGIQFSSSSSISAAKERDGNNFPISREYDINRLVGNQHQWRVAWTPTHRESNG